MPNLVYRPDRTGDVMSCDSNFSPLVQAGADSFLVHWERNNNRYRETL
jgi:hypothetical protein